MTKHLVTCVVTAAFAAVTVAAQGKADFSGTWLVDAEKSAAMNGGRTGGGSMSGGGGGSMVASGGGGNSMSVAGAGARAGGGAPIETKITQTAAALTIERATPAGPQKFVHKLDGTESVNVNGRATMKTKTHWQGATLVTEGTNTVASDNGDIVVTIKETRSIDKDGNLVVQTSRTMQDSVTNSAQVFAKKKM